MALGRLKDPAKQPKRGRLWLIDRSVIRLHPLYPIQDWRYEFIYDRAHHGATFRMLNVIEEFTREVLLIRVR